jgi:hypothetical protein
MTREASARDDEAESICRWGAARAGVIVVVPLLGTLAMMANHVYTVVRIGDVYGAKPSTAAVKGFVMAFAGALLGGAAATLVPLPFVQIPIAVGVTYGIAKAAQAWIKDGMPEDVGRYKRTFDDAVAFAKKHVADFRNDPRKDQPLGDEKKKL